jgi:hypothetical protein
MEARWKEKEFINKFRIDAHYVEEDDGSKEESSSSSLSCRYMQDTT